MTSPRPVELFRALAVLCEPPEPSHVWVAEALGMTAAPTAAEHTDAFVLGVPLYASVHLGPEGMIGGEARDRIAGFWRAVGQTPPAEPDHLGALLGLYAGLAEAATGDDAESVLADRARLALLHEHLASWVPALLERVAEPDGAYREWAALLGRALEEEVASSPSSDELSVHLREAPGMADPRSEGSAAFIGSLLAPVRSGMIVTRHDLARMGRGLGLGVRMGERRFSLESMLGQEAEGVLTALADYAGEAADAHDARGARYGETAEWWRDRARAAEALLRTLAADAAVAGAGESP